MAAKGYWPRAGLMCCYYKSVISACHLYVIAGTLLSNLNMTLLLLARIIAVNVISPELSPPVINTREVTITITMADKTLSFSCPPIHCRD